MTEQRRFNDEYGYGSKAYILLRVRTGRGTAMGCWLLLGHLHDLIRLGRCLPHVL